MPRFAASLMYQFTEWPLLERCRIARDCGFQAIEYQFPYGEDAAAFEDAVAQAGLVVALINAPAGDRTGGERGIGAIPGREAEFRDGLGEAVGWAQLLGCPRIHVMSGIIRPSEEQSAMMTYLENLRYAARLCLQEGLEVVIEPINGIDVPGYLVQRSDQARALISMIEEPNVGLLYDAYHARMMGEDPLEGLRGYLDVIRHVQIAEAPGRHEPDMETGAWREFFEACDTFDYAGVIGCEYIPRADTRDGLGWAAAYGISPTK